MTGAVKEQLSIKHNLSDGRFFSQTPDCFLDMLSRMEMGIFLADTGVGCWYYKFLGACQTDVDGRFFRSLKSVSMTVPTL